MERLRALSKEAVLDGGVGAGPAHEILRKETQWMLSVTQNALTVAVGIENWMSNLRQNLKLIPEEPDWIDTIQRCSTALCVGAGPSLTDEQLMLLDEFKGTLFCVNKTMKRLVEFTIPDFMVLIHPTDEVLAHISDEEVKQAMSSCSVITSTTIHPEVARTIEKHAKHVYWFNASVPDMYVENINHTLSVLTKAPVIDTLGNVGMFSCVCAHLMGANHIGLLGMEHSHALSDDWTNKQAKEYHIVFAPEDKMTFAVTPGFKTYINAFLDWYQSHKDECEVFNLSKFGILYVRRREAIEYMDLKDFIDGQYEIK